MPMVVLAAFLVLPALASIVFNSYILFLSCTQNFRQTRTTTHILLLHLGIINLLIAGVFLIGIFPSLLQDDWLTGSSCAALGSAWFTLHVAALWTLTALNVDKYVAIASPLHYARFVSPGRVGAALSLSWLLSAALCALPLAVPALQPTRRPPGCCLPDVAGAPPLVGRSYALVLALLGYFLPALLVASANGRILVIARHHRHRIVSALWDVTVSAQATVTPQRSHFYLTRYRGRSAANTVFHFVGTLFILYLPSAGTLLYEAMARVHAPPSVSLANVVLLAMAPAINGFVYGVKSKVLRKNFKNFLRKRLYRSEVNYEIQSRAPSAPASRRPSVTPSISLPLQQKLQRRMSEILIQPVTSASSPGGEPGAKLVRRSSELSFRPRGSTSSIPRDFISAAAARAAAEHPPPLAVASASSSSSSAPAPYLGEVEAAKGGAREQVNGSPTSPLARPPLRAIPPITKTSSLDAEQERAGGDVSPTTSTSHSFLSNHRPSLRRALFARNKQKSLDFEMTCLYMEESAPEAAQCPPRSASQQHVGELRSPSLARPLVLGQARPPPPPLSPARKTKRVSWSSDSFSAADESPLDSDSDTIASIAAAVSSGAANAVPLRYRKKAMLRNNGLRFDFSKLSLERIDSEDVRHSVDHGDPREDEVDQDSPLTPPVPPAPVGDRLDTLPPRSPRVANGKYANKANGHHEIAVAHKSRKLLEAAEKV